MKMDGPLKRPLPKALADFEKDIQAGKTRPSSTVELCNQFINCVQIKVDGYVHNLLKPKEEISENDLVAKLNEIQVLDNILSQEIEENNKIKSQIDNMKLFNKEKLDNVEKLKEEISTLERDIILKEKDRMDMENKIINAHNVNLKFLQMYEKFSGCNLKFESSDIIRFEFAPDIYISLYSEDWKRNWQLIDIKPNVIDRRSLEQKLDETDDVQALLACVYKSFKPLLK